MDLGSPSPHAPPHQGARDNLNPTLHGLGLSATLAINERSAQLIREGREIFKLGLGQSPFPVPTIMREALERNAHQKDYLAVQGLLSLRRAICDYLRRTRRLEFDPEDILVGPGTKELMFLIQLAYHGELVIPTPSWVSYAPQAHILGRPVKWLKTSPTSGLGVTPEALSEVCLEASEQARLLILNAPGNPTGTVYSQDQLAAIAQTARHHGVLVLSDEIYGGVQFDGRQRSIASLYPEGTIISDGLSKWAGAGGWRLGFFAFPKALSGLKAAMASVASETYTSVSAPIQHAATTGFEDHEEMTRYLQASRAILAHIADFVTRSLNEVGAELTPPQGGFYAFPSFNGLKDRLHARAITTGHELCERLLEEAGVATLPGSAFGRAEHDLSLRLAFVDFDGGPALNAYYSEGQLDENFLAQYTPQVLRAIKALCQWIRNQTESVNGDRGGFNRVSSQ